MSEPNRINPQLTEDTQTAEPAQQPDTTPETEPSTQTQTYTLEDVQKLIQSETDRRVTQALAKQRREYEKKLSLSGLDEQQRALAERDQQIEELKEQLREANAIRVKADLERTLTARGLPAGFADLIDIGSDPQEAQKKVDMLDKAFRSSVEEAVKAKLTGSAPGKGKPSAGMTREEFNKLSLSEMQSMARDNPELYQSMTKS